LKIIQPTPKKIFPLLKNMLHSPKRKIARTASKLAASIELLTKEIMQKNKESKGLLAKLKKFYLFFACRLKGKNGFGVLPNRVGNLSKKLTPHNISER
jgi:hypothetical protein